VGQDGIVSPQKLETFLKRHSETLKRFPDLHGQIATAGQAARHLQEVSKKLSEYQDIFFDPKKSAFAAISGFEDPSRAVQQAISSARPVESLRMLARFANRGGKDTRDGLAASVFDNAFRQASKSGDFSFERYASGLEEPLGKGMPSVLEVLKKEGVITVDAERRMKELVSRAQKIESGLNGRISSDELIGEPDGIFDTVVRIAGAKASSALSRSQGGGESLIVAARGSRLARNYFEQVPITRIKDVLTEAALNPEFMATLLTRANTPVERAKIGNQIHGYLLHAGIISGEEAATPRQPTASKGPMPGARKAEDGMWYVPDKGRPGKYLKVEPRDAAPSP
jgi:hypothetical protein